MITLLLCINSVICCAASDPEEKHFEDEIRAVEVAALTRMRTRSFSGIMDQKPDALANLDRLTGDDKTALLENVARKKGECSEEFARRLIASGADPSGKRNVGSLATGKSISTMSPLDLAILRGNVPVVKVLLANKEIDLEHSRLISDIKLGQSHAEVRVMHTYDAVNELIRRAEKRYWQQDKDYQEKFTKEEILEIRDHLKLHKRSQKVRKKYDKRQKKAEEKAAGKSTSKVLGFLRFKK